MQPPIDYRRHLPHSQETGTLPVFLTWSLHGAIPPNRGFQNASESAFVALDRILDRQDSGNCSARWLQLPDVAQVVEDAIRFNADQLRHYDLDSYVVMPNHVHLLVERTLVPIPIMMKSLKGITARRANLLLTRTGQRFWQDETFDYTAKDRNQFNRIRRYIENNPIKAGLVAEPHQYRWSSAWRPD